MNATELHDKAMGHLDKAFLARRAGDLERANSETRQAFGLEKQAASLLRENYEAEPSRSLLYSSAATLAWQCEEWEEAKQLAKTGLEGKPPDEIASELRDLLQDIESTPNSSNSRGKYKQDEIALLVRNDARIPSSQPKEVRWIAATFYYLLLRTANRLRGDVFSERPSLLAQSTGWMREIAIDSRNLWQYSESKYGKPSQLAIQHENAASFPIMGGGVAGSYRAYHGYLFSIAHGFLERGGMNKHERHTWRSNHLLGYGDSGENYGHLVFPLDLPFRSSWDFGETERVAGITLPERGISRTWYIPQFQSTLQPGQFFRPETIFRVREVPPEVLNDILIAFYLLGSNEIDSLRRSIPDKAYFLNFLSLARQLAPSKVEDSKVSLHAKSAGGLSWSAGLNVSRDDITNLIWNQLAPIENASVNRQRIFLITGKLINFESYNEGSRISIMDSGGQIHHAISPPGMIDDLAPHLATQNVTIQGIKRSHDNLLLAMDPA